MIKGIKEIKKKPGFAQIVMKSPLLATLYSL